jgi:adenine nucleotide transporter 17
MALTIALSNFIFFYTLQTLKKLTKQSSISLTTSTIAGIFNALLTNPLWVANLRLVKENFPSSSQSSSLPPSSSLLVRERPRYRGLIHCLQQICKQEGILQLWAGTGASLLLVSNPAIQYYIYEKCKMNLLKRHETRFSTSRSSLRPMEAFLVGALAKGIATIATYPLQLAQVIMRLQTSCHAEKHENQIVNDTMQERKSHSTKVYSNLLDCMVTLYKGGGIKALYTGINAKMIQTILSSALTFLTYEQILHVVAKCCWIFSKKLGTNRTAMN